MCRASIDGGRRCLKHNPYGIRMHNLQAKKQYHAKLLQSKNLNPKRRTRSINEMATVMREMDNLHAAREALGKVIPHVMELTPATESILNTLQAAGYRPYIVGGSVRDSRMGLSPKDVDIEVHGGEADDIARSLRGLGRVDEVGKAFGVLKITLAGEDFDVSLPRRDSKTGTHHRDFEVEVDPNLTIAEAAARRDYTINALMYDHHLGFIIDPHGGLADMEAGYLRHVSDAFDEDPLRVLRGVQMAARFNMQLHPDTIVKAATLRDAYASLARERVQMEFQKLYSKGTHLSQAMTALRATGWNRLLPGLTAADQTALDADVTRIDTALAENEIPASQREKIIAALLARHLEPQQRELFLTYTTVSGDIKQGALGLTTTTAPQLDDASLRHWVRDLPRQVKPMDWLLYQKLAGNPSTAEMLRLHLGELNILTGPEQDLLTGDDVLTAYTSKKPGPWVKAILDMARAAQYKGQYRTRADALHWLTLQEG